MKLLFWCAVLAVVIIGCSAWGNKVNKVKSSKHVDRTKKNLAGIAAFTAQLSTALDLGSVTSLVLDDSLSGVLNILGGATQVVGGILTVANGLLKIVTAGVYFISLAVSTLANLGLELLVNGQVVSAITGTVLNTVVELLKGDILSINLSVLGDLDILGVGSLLGNVAGSLLMNGCSLSGFRIG